MCPISFFPKGIFQKTLASRTTEVYAFDILDQLIAHNPYSALAGFVPTIFQLLFHRMMENKTPQYIRLFIHSLSLFSSTYGGQVLFEACESIQAGMTTLIVTKILAPNIATITCGAKPKLNCIVVGLSKLLCDSNVLQNVPTWSELCQAIVAILVKSSESSGIELKSTFVESFLEGEENAEAREFDNTFSKLAYAHVPPPISSLEAAQPGLYFITSLSALCAKSPGQFSGILGSCLDAEGGACLQSLLTQSGLSIV